MQTFRRLFKQITCDHGLSDLYEKECNVCPFTVRIFEKIEDERIDLSELARSLGLSLTAIEELKDADCCDPHVVIDLCRHLHLTAPRACPKIENRKKQDPRD